jgi:hypothetical protein
MMFFPHEEPTKGDFQLWAMALWTTLSPTLRHSPPLGKYLRQPFDTEICWKGSDQSTTAYEPEQGGRKRRSGNFYTQVDDLEGPTPQPASSYVTATKGVDGRVRITSDQIIKRNEDKQTTVLQNLLDMDNSSLWLHIGIGEAGNWIRDAVINRKLITCHDGSHMTNLATDVNATALTICCKETRNNRGEGIGMGYSIKCYSMQQPRD